MAFIKDMKISIAVHPWFKKLLADSARGKVTIKRDHLSRQF